MSEANPFTSLNERQKASLADKVVTREILAGILRALPDGQAIFDAAQEHVVGKTERAEVDPEMAEALRESLRGVERRLLR